jgi:hypothetical protein
MRDTFFAPVFSELFKTGKISELILTDRTMSRHVEEYNDAARILF